MLKNKIEFTKNNLITIFRVSFIFLLFLIVGLFINPLKTDFSDGFWCYSFGYGISKGFIPYVDFNMIVPVFYPLISSIFLNIFGTGYHIYIIFHTILMTFMFYYLFKLYDDRAWLFLIMILFSYFLLIQPTYNSFLLLVFYLLLYLEKNNKNDYLIGLLIGISIITKFNIGLFFLLPSLLYWKNKKKIIKRLIGSIIPCLLFLIYLIINNNLFEFIDLCIMGLFSFSNDNSTFFISGCLIVFLIMISYIIYCIYKDRTNIINYYVLVSLTFCLPIIDFNHLYFFMFCFIAVFIEKIKFNKIYSLFIIVFSIIASSYLFFVFYDGANIKSFKSNNDFKYYYINDLQYKQISGIMDKYDEYGDVIIIGDDYLGSFFDIYYNKRISYLDIFSMGNYGYDEFNNLVSYINQKDNQVFIIKKDENIRMKQYYKSGSDYIKKNSEYLGDVFSYEVYLFSLNNNKD